jgi:hypothetical protein
VKEYRDFLARLRAKSWEFCFVIEYRGYVQHAGLTIDSSNRLVNDSSIRVEVTANAATLIRDGKAWARSNLSASRGDIDLIKTLRAFHIAMLQSYAPYVAKTFFPDLQNAADFYAALTEEAHAKDRGARMIFFENEPRLLDQTDGIRSGKFNLIMVPNDVFREFGVKVEQV